MRSSIKAISFGITAFLFVLLNIYWHVVNPGGTSVDTSNPAYYVVLVIVLGSILAIAIYFWLKSKQKTKIKL